MTPLTLPYAMLCPLPTHSNGGGEGGGGCHGSIYLLLLSQLFDSLDYLFPLLPPAYTSFLYSLSLQSRHKKNRIAQILSRS